MGYRVDRRSIGGNTLTGGKQYDPAALMQFLAEARRTAGLTQAGAARATGGQISQDYLSRMEAGEWKELKFNDVAELAAVYGLSLPSVAIAAKLPVARTAARRRPVAVRGATEDTRLNRIIAHLQHTADAEWRESFIDRMHNLVVAHEDEGDPVQ